MQKGMSLILSDNRLINEWIDESPRTNLNKIKIL